MAAQLIVVSDPTMDLDAGWVRLERIARGGIEVCSPNLFVQVVDDDGDGVYVASDAFSSVYGAGDSREAALRDYVDSLVYQFETLNQDEASLGMLLRQELSALREHLQRSH